MKMYYIAVYDIADKRRLPRVLKIFRRFMFWIQNSSFEGELTEGQFKELKKSLKEVVKKEEDSILFFYSEKKKFISRVVMGFEKNEITNFI